MTGLFTEPRVLPVVAIWAGDEVLVDAGRWVPVDGLIECEEDDCPLDDACEGVLVLKGGVESHVDAHATRTVRIPVKQPAAPTPAGPAPADRVWVSIARRGIDMHRIAEVDKTRCGRNTSISGHRTTAAEATRLWASKPCPRCWPTSKETSR